MAGTHLDTVFGRIPVKLHGIVGDLLDLADHAGAVLAVDLEYSLLGRVLPAMPELPRLDLLLVGLVFSEDDH